MTPATTPLPAAATLRVRELLDGPVVEGRVIGTFPTACYVELPTGRVVAVVTRDAVRLPCGLVLAQHSSELRLDLTRDPVLVGAGRLSVGGLAVRVARTRSATVPSGLSPDPASVTHAAALLAELSFAEHPACAIEALAEYVDLSAAADRLSWALVGGGTGLTPSGDDVLAGFLVAASAFGVSHEQLARAVVDRSASGGRTTPLSATLLRHATYGEAVPQVTRLIGALAAPARPPEDVTGAVAAVVSIGHSSGVALATGVVSACLARLAAT